MNSTEARARMKNKGGAILANLAAIASRASARGLARRHTKAAPQIEFPPGYFTALMRLHDWPPGFFREAANA